MPRKRVQPNKRWLSSKPPRPVARKLTAAERDRLKAIVGLPESVLPAVEEIARHCIRLESYPVPSKAEMHASLTRLSTRIAVLQKQIKETDLYTMHIMSANYVRRALGDPSADLSYPDLPGRVESDLREFKSVVDLVAMYLRRTKSVWPAARGMYVASLLRDVFQKFKIPFSLSQRSPAVETVNKILNMVRSTGVDAARHAVRRAMQHGDKRLSSTRSRI